jgi:hypothetical protein
MSATEIFPLDVLADICAIARENHARDGRGVLFIKPMPDGSGRLDSQYFQMCQLLTLAPLKKNAGFDLVGVASHQAAVYEPERQCVLLWMGEDERIYCETIDDPQAALNGSQSS